jgi:hypothetical protein
LYTGAHLVSYGLDFIYGFQSPIRECNFDPIGQPMQITDQLMKDEGPEEYQGEFLKSPSAS